MAWKELKIVLRPLGELPPQKELPDDEKRAGWLSNVELSTHSAPFRPLWAGPQFSFNSVHSESEEPLTSSELIVQKT